MVHVAYRPAAAGPPSWWGALVVVLVAVGYGLAMTAGTAGQGVQLLGDLALYHGQAPLEAPRLVPETTLYLQPGTTALRPAPATTSAATPDGPEPHGEPMRISQRGDAVLALYRVVWPAPAAPGTRRGEQAASGGAGLVRRWAFGALAFGAPAHGAAFLHTHHGPEPVSAVVLRTGIDQHGLPPALAVPLPAFQMAPERAGWSSALASADLSVETPPPLA